MEPPGLGDEPDEPGHGVMHAEHIHLHSDYNGSVHSHAHVHRGDRTHRPGPGHRHGPPNGPAAAAGGLPGLDELDERDAEAVYDDMRFTAAAPADDLGHADLDLDPLERLFGGEPQ